jgi:DNA-directed RNA polymerase specialized sigma24 family protein
VVHPFDPTLESWRDHAKRPGTRRDLLGRTVKDLVKYTPKNRRILAHMRALHDWQVFLAVDDVYDSYPNASRDGQSAVVRAAYSKFLSKLQSVHGRIHVWPSHLPLLIRIAKAKANDALKDARNPAVIQLSGEPESALEDPLEEMLLQELETLVNRLKSGLGDERLAPVIDGMIGGQSREEIAEDSGLTSAEVDVVADFWRHWCDKETQVNGE